MFSGIFTPIVFLEGRFAITPHDINCEDHHPFKNTFKVGEVDLSQVVIAIIYLFQEQGNWKPIKLQSILENDEPLFNQCELLTNADSNFSKLLEVDENEVCRVTNIFVYLCHCIAGFPLTRDLECPSWPEPPCNPHETQEAENDSDLD